MVGGREGRILGTPVALLEEPASQPQTRLPRFCRVLWALTKGGARREWVQKRGWRSLNGRRVLSF